MRSASFTATIIIALSIPTSHAFQASRGAAHIAAAARPTLSISPLFAKNEAPLTSSDVKKIQLSSSSITTAAAAAAAALFLATAAPVNAVSGGGLDYAGLDISNQDFSKGTYKGKDFTQVIAKAATFAGSNLQVSANTHFFFSRLAIVYNTFTFSTTKNNALLSYVDFIFNNTQKRDVDSTRHIWSTPTLKEPMHVVPLSKTHPWIMPT